MKHKYPSKKVGMAIAPALMIALAWAGAVAAADGQPSEPGANTLHSMSIPGPSGDWFGDGPMPLMPDDNGYVNEGRAPAVTLSYYTVSGATLRGRSSTAGYTYLGLGCTDFTTPTDRWLNTELPIPDGATIKFLRIYYYDTSATGSVTAYLTRYQPGVTTDDITSIGSTPVFNAGYGTSLSETLTHVVDNTNFAYTLLASTSVASSTLRICGMRIAYYAP